MIIKDIAKQGILEIGNILPLKKINIIPIKINKSIEIVVVPNFGEINSHQDNVGIILEEKKVLRILSKRYKNVLITEINSEEDLEALVKRKPDLVFSGVKYFYFNNKTIWLNDYLEMFEIPYIASSKAALDNESDKNRAKKIMQKNNIRTADFFITNPGEYLKESSIPIKFPLFIKPVTGGDSRGVDKNSIVLNFKSFTAKVLDIKVNQKSPSLVETYLAGKEYSVGIFEDSIDGSLRAMPIEIIVKKNIDGYCILDFDVKKNDEEKVVLVSDKKIFKKLTEIAKNSFVALGGKSLGRIDIKMDHLGEPHFIEANLMPGLRKGYFYRSCVLNLDMSYDDMIFSIANTGLSSH
ncbi:D-alanine--D-alanine ligase [Candidatus Pelagibacter sp.]|jgi:D-alanine-D-alanine ligase|nr:D-alanine--D-alanine ligase [Candidatus Pelagibacter bacterium]MDB3886422.1 D-alanine--D-alanine ligase [Candidatus Pelagibacter sp.]MDB3904444.1 D-alanine--D-alanine ligase [Candidatus Pelagibacter sp.]MDC0397783.1 D-alanine--D-alanine ligase [Candidatus Pelagibacter sp.]MDC0901101.1 D-alanine--D-alanine ligase [Candidatus Pelagibacter sp.]